MNAERNCRHCADTGMATLGSTNSLFCSWCNNDGTRIHIAGPPHPDTARADAAERMLAGVIRSLECHDLNLLGSVVAVDNPGLAAWWSDWQVKHDRVRRIADLTARRDRERAALAATERELEALTR